MFRTVSLSITRSFFFRCRHSNGICHTGLLTACEQDRDGTQLRPDPACKLYDIYRCCVYSDKLLIMDRGTVRNMQIFYSKNKFEILVHLVCFIIRIYHDARSPERQNIMRVEIHKQVK